MVAPATEQIAGVLAAALKDSGVRLAPDASTHLLAHLGDDSGRVPELVEVLAAAYGSGATISVDEVEVYLGDVGTAGPFDLTNASIGATSRRRSRCCTVAHGDEHALRNRCTRCR